uniref:CHORD domain-containing protein n=1 Tax=Bigelowiella natans TaxID=227086 RepID=A0A6U3JH86_BIGNA|mmetsp:Transcript_2153/g.3250  ORF Transcript_2153/g.3250 Transcript_2153/m.3250 type:complete len:316 (+) Transcript_2153:107-1054(+)
MPLKITLHYDDCAEERQLQLSMKIPKKWRGGPVDKVTDFFVEYYNGKFPENPLDPKQIHAENAGGSKFHADDVVEVSFINKEHIYIKGGAPPRNEEKRRREKENDPSLLTCQNYGCQVRYREEENGSKACYHHRLGPVFWNGYKYWACCSERKAYDWNDFMKIPGCLCGPHSTKKPEGSELLSPTIIAARQAELEAKKRAAQPQLNDINAYMKESKKAEKPKKKPAKKKEILPEGQKRCALCKELFVVKDNHDKACLYHRGQAVFHDGAKYWTCCSEDRKAYDWDQFMKIKPCSLGRHWDGEGDNPNELNCKTCK